MSGDHNMHCSGNQPDLVIGDEIAEIERLEKENVRFRIALNLIAAPMRPDGTYNRDRDACRILAEEALK